MKTRAFEDTMYSDDY